MIFQILLIIGVFIGSILVLLTVIGASVYDARQIKYERVIKSNPNARRFRKRPIISVVLLTHSSQESVDSSLQSIIASNYRKLEIIVVDRNSSDNTRRIVRKFITDHPKKTIKLVNQKKFRTIPDAIATASKGRFLGDLVLLLEAGQLLDSQALTKANFYFNVHTRLQYLVLNRSLSTMSNLGSLFQRIEQMSTSPLLKLQSTIGMNRDSLATGAMYRRAFFLEYLKVSSSIHRKNQHSIQADLPNTVTFGGNALLYIQPPTSMLTFVRKQYEMYERHISLFPMSFDFRSMLQRKKRKLPPSILMQLLTLLKIAFVVLAIPLICYFVFLAVQLHQPILYGMSCVTIVVLAVYIVLEDETLTAKSKVMYICLAPIFITAAYLLAVLFISALIGASFKVMLKVVEKVIMQLRSHSLRLTRAAIR